MEDMIAMPSGVPAPVARAAAEHGLGEFIALRSWGERGYVMKKLAVSGGALAAMALVIALLHFLYFLSIIFLLTFVWAISNAIAAIVRGPQLNALYVNGIVHTGRDGLVVAAWPQVARLGRSGSRRELTGGRRFPLYLQDGRRFDIPRVQSADGADQFIRRLAASLREHGRVVE
jgi:hypothetical protein